MLGGGEALEQAEIKLYRVHQDDLAPEAVDCHACADEDVDLVAAVRRRLRHQFQADDDPPRVLPQCVTALQIAEIGLLRLEVERAEELALVVMQALNVSHSSSSG